MKNSHKGIIGGVIAVVSNAIANYVTFGSLQPENIAIGMVAGAVLGYFMINGKR